MNVSLSEKREGILAVVGHAGCGHCHSHNNQVQDDSAGLATVLRLFQEATRLSLVIKDIRIRSGIDGYIEVETVSGGYGKATARRGITPDESRLAQRLIGKPAVCSQKLVMEAFGRYYGQGISETPVALQTAISNASLDTFVKNYPLQFHSGYENVKGSAGLIAGTVLDFEGVPVSVLGTVNASRGGIGPVEDLEGNAAIGKKAEIMAALGMSALPTIVIEAKAYNEAFAKELEENTFIVKADPQDDNPYVARCILNAARTLNLPAVLKEDVMARVPGAMVAMTNALAQKIVGLGEKLKNCEYSQEKVSVLADLALLVSQDGGGISFMSNKLHEIIGGAGGMPGTGAVINYCVTADDYKEVIVPVMTADDLDNYVALTKQAVIELGQALPEASIHARQNRYAGSLERFVWSEF